MSNKVSVLPNLVPSGDCNLITDFGVYNVFDDTLNAFQSGLGGIVLALPWDQNRQQQIAVSPSGETLAHRSKSGGNWDKWVPIATATPPEEYDLPLADGFSVWGVCSYFKTQDGIVTLNVNISNTLVTAGNEVIIGTLPVGFRPIGHVIAAAYCSGAGYIFIDYLGAIRMRGDADWTLGHASVTFRAY